MNDRKRIRAVTDRIAAQGGRVDEVTKGKHYKVWFTNPQGEKRMLVVSLTPSDWRAEKANEMVLRRLMR